MSLHKNASTATAAHAAELAGDVPDWIELIPAGKFAGRDGRGPYLNDKPEQVIAAFKAGKIDMPIDYDHQLVFTRENGRGAPAAAWVKELEIRGGAIWGRVEWTAAARERILAKEYRFISPVFQHERSTGRVIALANAGLVNDPNLHLTALASRQADHPTGDSEQMTIEELMKLLRGAFSLADTVGETAVVEHAKSLAETVKLAAVALSLEPSAAGKDLVTAAQRAQTAATAEPDPSKYIPLAMHKAVSDELAALKAGTADDAAVAAVEAAITAGKVPPAQKAWALNYAKKDPADFADYVATAAQVVHGRSTGDKPPAGDPAKTLDDVDRAICQRMGITPEDYLKSMEA